MLNRQSAARYIKTCRHNCYFPAWVQTRPQRDGKDNEVFWMPHAFHFHNLLVSWWVSHTHPCMEFAGNILKKRKHWRRMVWREARVTHVATTCDWGGRAVTSSESSARPLSFHCNIRLKVSEFCADDIKAHIPCTSQFLGLQRCFRHKSLRPCCQTSSDGHFQHDDDATLHVFTWLKLVCWLLTVSALTQPPVTEMAAQQSALASCPGSRQVTVASCVCQKGTKTSVENSSTLPFPSTKWPTSDWTDSLTDYLVSIFTMKLFFW